MEASKVTYLELGNTPFPSPGRIVLVDSQEVRNKSSHKSVVFPGGSPRWPGSPDPPQVHISFWETEARTSMV